MIDPKSLRIGNYLISNREYFDKPTLGQVYQVGESLVFIEYTEDNGEKRRISNPINVLSGIPLSEQELIRLGFEKRRIQFSLSVGGELKYYWDNGVFIIWQINEGAFTLDRIFRGVSSPKPSRVFNEVHVLQNIAYYLYGQELVYKVASGLTNTDTQVHLKSRGLTPTEPDTKEPVYVAHVKEDGSNNPLIVQKNQVIGSNGIINGEYKEDV